MTKDICIVSPARMHDIILRPDKNEPEHYLCLDYIREGRGLTLIAIDNTTEEAWTEEFDNIKDAANWLRDPKRKARHEDK